MLTTQQFTQVEYIPIGPSGEVLDSINTTGVTRHPLEGILASATGHGVTACSSYQHVIATTTYQDVIASKTTENIGIAIPSQRVIEHGTNQVLHVAQTVSTCATSDLVITINRDSDSCCAIKVARGIITIATIQGVIARSTDKNIVTLTTIQIVIACSPKQDIVTSISVKRVIP